MRARNLWKWHCMIERLYVHLYINFGKNSTYMYVCTLHCPTPLSWLGVWSSGREKQVFDSVQILPLVLYLVYHLHHHRWYGRGPRYSAY